MKVKNSRRPFTYSSFHVFCYLRTKTIMRNNSTINPSDLNESISITKVNSARSFGRIPKSWIIVAIFFYCASVITVGLLAGLLPRRIQHITIYATLTPNTSMTTTPNPSVCVDDECNPRLVSDLIVHTYELEYLYNDNEQTIAQGQVTINFTLKQPVKQLIYHAKRLLNLETPMIMQDGVHQHVTMRSYSPNDYISLRLNSNTNFIEDVPYLLTQKFAVNLTDGNVGFYQNIFKDGDEEMKKLLATKFQPTDARKAFPCFDEPHLKARFRINIIHPVNTIALANFPMISEEPWENDLIYTKFQETFPMSTYLAAWAILPNTYGQTKDDSSNVTVWARQKPTQKSHTDFALQIALNSLEFFKDYFNTDEPVPPKTDLLSVPDFSSGAMENWGLVSFREDRIIFDEKIASTTQKQELAETMAHEIAHFWFGNYVTCKWWDDLWLNEAMATWLSYKPFGIYYSDWNFELQALTVDSIPVMWDDAKPSSHSIVVENITTAAAITSLFDSITYSKGASILRMLEKTVGSEKFRISLQDYLISNRFDVGDPNTFYNGLFNNPSISGEDFMKSWLEEQNYPLIKVNLSVENNETKLIFTQSRFIISNALNTSHLNGNYRWKINIACSAGGRDVDSVIEDLTNETINFLLETEQKTITIPGKSYAWVKCNRDFHGFFVTEYSFPWTHFSDVLDAEPTFFSNEDKVNLMQDAFLLAYRGLVDYSAPLMIIKSLVRHNIEQYVHWRTFEWHWETLGELIDYRSEILPEFQNFAIEQILSNGNTLDRILTTNPDDNHNMKLIKGLQFSLLCRMNHSEAIERVSTLFRSIPIEYFNNSDVDIGIDSNFLSTVYTYHIRTSQNDADWQIMFNYYRVAISPQEQTRALVAISSTNNSDRLNQLLNDGLDTIKRQDYFAMMGYMSQHSVGRDVVWTFYRQNYERLVQIFTLENRRFGTAILAITRTFETETYLHEMHNFFGKYPNAGAAASARKQALDQVAMNIEWIRTREENLRQAFNTLF